MAQREICKYLYDINECCKRLVDFTDGKITDCRRIVAFRNLLIHGYADVDDELVWGIVENQLPKLCDEVQVLLDGYS